MVFYNVCDSMIAAPLSEPKWPERCSPEQMYWRGVLVPRPPGLEHPDLEQLDSEDSEDAIGDFRERLAIWQQRERQVFGLPGRITEESEHQKSYVACRPDAVSWLSYILTKYDAVSLLPHAVMLLDAYVLKVAWPDDMHDGFWTQAKQLENMPPNAVLISLGAIARITVKMEKSRNDAFNQHLAVYVLSGILDAVGTQPVSLDDLMRLFNHEELKIFYFLGGNTWLTTPLEWAHLYLSQFGPQVHHVVSHRRARREVQEWAKKLLNMIPVTPQLTPQVLGLAACVLTLIQNGIMASYPAWNRRLQSMGISFCEDAPMNMEQFAQAVGFAVNDLFVLVENTTIKYCNEVILRFGVDAHLNGDDASSTISTCTPTGISSEMSLIDQHAPASAQETRADHDSAADLQCEAIEGKVILMINKLPRAANHQDILQTFKEFNPTNVRIVTDKKNVSRCYCFLQLADHASARQAYDACRRLEMNMQDPHGKTWTLEAKWSVKSTSEHFWSEPKNVTEQVQVPFAKRRRPPEGLKSCPCRQ